MAEIQEGNVRKENILMPFSSSVLSLQPLTQPANPCSVQQPFTGLLTSNLMSTFNQFFPA